MARRLTLSAWRAGASEAAAQRLERSFLAAIELRAPVVTDAGDAAFLHPARTALILLDDAGLVDPAALAAAPLVESLDYGLRPGAAFVKTVLDARAAALLAAVPLPVGPGEPGTAARDPDADALLLEQLVSAPGEACLVALAEHLDQARHLHLRLRLPRTRRAAEHAPRGRDAALATQPSRPDAAALAIATEFHRQASEVYLPVAARTNALLAARLERWAGAFQRRLLRLRP